MDFSNLKDGTYTGEYEGGMYKWRTNSVRVTVSGGKVTQIEPLSGIEDQGDGKTQMLYDRVIQAQSLQVDTNQRRDTHRERLPPGGRERPACRRSKANNCFALRRETR